jgi:hypothetical protein
MWDHIINLLAGLLVLAIIVGAFAKLFDLLRRIAVTVLHFPREGRAAFADFMKALRVRKIIDTKMNDRRDKQSVTKVSE